MTRNTWVLSAIVLVTVFISGYQYLRYLDLGAALKEAAAANERLTASIAALELEIGDLVAFEAERLQQNAEAATAVRRQTSERDLLQARVAAEHDQLMQAARSEASAATTYKQPDLAASFERIIEERQKNRDLLRAQSRRKVELQFSGMLAALGITGERLENILETLATTDLEFEDLLASRATQQISIEEFNKVFPILDPKLKIRDLLNETELAVFEERVQQQVSPSVDIRHRRLQVLAPGLSDDVRQSAALAISRGMERSREMFDQLDLDEVERSHAMATHRIESVIPAIREDLRGTLTDSEYQEVDNYLRILTAEQEKALRIAEARSGR